MSSAPRESNGLGASPDRLAEWQRRAYSVLAARSARFAGWDDALPIDMLAEPEATRRAVARLRA